ncbi:CehA/McbA family metallohydrolase [Stygiolobus caldivivus]|uniref:CehA/McbA family metallohydrolase n=1 Tax=Stygiolobus caldivivus TaxID=2824673 RepID=UPI001C848CE9|nr:PHP domain-containing protein [Stygiolobus caldivivus]
MKIDLHVHTFYSDGKYSPELMIKTALKKGLDGIAITDHDTSEAHKRIKGYPVVPGQEVSTQYGHVVILCNFPPDPPRDIQQLIDYSKENNCLIFPSHPFDIFRAGIGEKVFSYKFDAIEVFNSKAPKSANEKALKASQALGLPGLANSDSHVSEALGSAYNELQITEFRVDDILEELKKGRVKPIGIGLTAKAKLKIVEWSILRKLKIAKNTRRTMYPL